VKKNSNAAKLIVVIQLAALQIAKLLLVNSDSFNPVRRTDDSNFNCQSLSSHTHTQKHALIPFKVKKTP